MLTDTTREEWMRGWSEGAFDVTVGLISHAEARAYLRACRTANINAAEYGYVAALSAALGVI